MIKFFHDLISNWFILGYFMIPQNEIRRVGTEPNLYVCIAVVKAASVAGAGEHAGERRGEEASSRDEKVSWRSRHAERGDESFPVVVVMCHSDTAAELLCYLGDGPYCCLATTLLTASPWRENCLQTTALEQLDISVTSTCQFTILVFSLKIGILIHQLSCSFLAYLL